MKIAIALCDRFTALDVIGPYQVLSVLPGAETLQLAIEYDPQPPTDAGSPAKARPEIVAGVQKLFAGILATSA